MCRNACIFIVVVLRLSVGFSRPQENVYSNDDDDGEKPTYVSVIFDEQSKNLVIKEGAVKPYVALASFKNTFNSTGWSLLKLSTNDSYANDIQAEAAGIAEGYATADHISMAFQNTMQGYCDNEKEFCDKLKAFLKSNSDWLQQQIKDNPTSSYWHQVSLIYKQLEGLHTGYSEKKVKPEMSMQDFVFLQIGGDLEDLESALGKKSQKKVLGSGSCSALVKLFPKNADLAISQVTWNDFNAMLRIYKLYNLTYYDSGNVIEGAVASFSSYPGLLYSGDDFHILSSGLVSQETTIGNGNKDLWQYIQPTTLLEWVRTIVANRLARTGNQWCSIFEKYNSGTYNNQWMILDYKLFEAGKPLKPDTFWVLEQLPGTVHMADMSVFLQQQGYWASYNLPYFPYVYNISGVAESKKQHGSWFDYNENPRAQIFKRDHNKVTDMSTLVKLMRYNDFQHDVLSKCDCKPPYSGENAISARSDLNPANGTYPFGALGHRRHGGTDCKATNAGMSKKLSQFVVAGPTSDQQAPFQWSKTEWKRPLGHPDVFKFEPNLLDWTLEDWTDKPTEV